MSSEEKFNLDGLKKLLSSGAGGVSIEVQLSTSVGLLLDPISPEELGELDASEVVRRLATMVILRMFGVNVTPEQAGDEVDIPRPAACVPNFAERLCNHSDISLRLAYECEPEELAALSEEEAQLFSKSTIFIRIMPEDVQRIIERLNEPEMGEPFDSKFVDGEEGGSPVDLSDSDGVPVEEPEQDENEAWKDWVKKQVLN